MGYRHFLSLVEENGQQVGWDLAHQIFVSLLYLKIQRYGYCKDVLKPILLFIP